MLWRKFDFGFLFSEPTRHADDEAHINGCFNLLWLYYLLYSFIASCKIIGTLDICCCGCTALLHYYVDVDSWLQWMADRDGRRMSGIGHGYNVYLLITKVCPRCPESDHFFWRLRGHERCPFKCWNFILSGMRQPVKKNKRVGFANCE